MKSLIVVTSAALAVSALMFTGCYRNNTGSPDAHSTDNRTTGQKTADTIRNAGDKTANAAGEAVDKTGQALKTAGNELASSTQPTAASIDRQVHDVLADIVNASLSTNGFNDVVGYLDNADRQAITINNNANGDLKQMVQQFRTDFRAKYGQDFQPRSEVATIFTDSFATVTPRTVNEARTASARTGPGNEAVPATPNTTPTNNVTYPGANAASVTIAATDGRPPLHLELINEGTMVSQWRIEVPHNMDATQLQKNLLQQVTTLENDKANWPASVTDGYRMASDRMLSALK